MPITKKNIRGTGIVQLKSVRSSTEGTTETEVQTWLGLYTDLEIKRQLVRGSAKSTNLEHVAANEGRLTVTYESTLSDISITQNSSISTEVIWQELRKPVETNPAFAELSSSAIASIKDAAEKRTPLPSSDPLETKLYDLLVKGTTEWSTGVPIVRRTTTRIRGNVGGGSAWLRDTPPVSVPGTWEWLKTADERRKDGKSYTRTEEWTAAEKWDSSLYP